VRGALTASSRIRALDVENARLRTELEAADVARRVDQEGYKQVQRSLGDMQSEIGRLKQDLSFYRGLVQPDSLVHVKVQQMQIVPEAAAGQYRLKFVLMQTGKPDKEVSGSASLVIDGLEGGKPQSLNFAEISPNRRPSLAYSLRYFQDYDEVVRLPKGFEPTRVGVELHSGKDQGRGFRQAFAWKAQGMSVEMEANGGTAPKDAADVQTETE
jgi:HAMP domain-containing protein